MGNLDEEIPTEARISLLPIVSEKETVKSGSRKHSVISKLITNSTELLDEFAREKTQYEYPTYPHRSIIGCRQR